MSTKKKISKEYDKFWHEDRPGFDYEYVERLVAPEDFDEVVRSSSERFGLRTELDPADFMPDRKKQEELLTQVYETAAKVLSKSQYKIFVMRYLFGLKEVDIAKQINTSQAYIAKDLPVIHYKIKKALQIKAVNPRPKQKIKSKKPTKKKRKKSS